MQNNKSKEIVEDYEKIREICGMFRHHFTQMTLKCRWYQHFLYLLFAVKRLWSNKNVSSKINIFNY